MGGFGLPFFTVGGLAFAVATAMIFVIPKIDNDEEVKGEEREGDGFGTINGGLHTTGRKQAISYRKVMVCPTLLLPFADALVCFLGNGFLESMLQPYAVQSGATVGQVGVIFLALGGTYMVFCTLAGQVSNWL